jgi:transcriptional regulator with XRE-family HTH domain
VLLLVITREQLKMARAALGWSVRDLAKRAGVAANTVSRYENGADAYGDTLAKLQRALEAGGVVFLNENGDGPGVRLKKR